MQYDIFEGTLAIASGCGSDIMAVLDGSQEGVQGCSRSDFILAELYLQLLSALRYILQISGFG